MSISCISDIHIKEEGDFGEKVLMAFLENPDVLKSQTIFLLGDIFDLMVGDYVDYLSKFKTVFDRFEDLAKTGKKIVWLEGNHDFHIAELINNFKLTRNIPDENLILSDQAFFYHINDKTIRLSHGDDIEIGNYSYKIYKSIIRSSFIANLMKFLIPFSFVEKVGMNASKKSRHRNEERYTENSNEDVKALFRKSAERIAKKSDSDLIICGHSHVKDCFVAKRFSYLNNGFCKATKCFTHLCSKGEASLKSLDVRE